MQPPPRGGCGCRLIPLPNERLSGIRSFVLRAFSSPLGMELESVNSDQNATDESPRYRGGKRALQTGRHTIQPLDLSMYFSHDMPTHALPQDSVLQHCAACPPAVLKEAKEVSNGPLPLKLEYQAARQVGAALACRRVTEFIKAGYMAFYPGFSGSLLLLGQGRAIKPLPVADRSMRLLGTITHVLLGHMAGCRLPSSQEQTALCSFLNRLDEGSRTTVPRTGTDPFMALAQQQDSHGHSLLYLAVNKGMVGLAEWLLNRQPASFSATAPFPGEKDEQTNPLLLAVKEGDESMVRLLLEKNADLNVRDVCGRTPLFWAVDGSYESIDPLFLSEGLAAANVRDNTDKRPLPGALESGYESIARLLLDRGADVNVWDHYGISPLLLAVQRWKTNMVSVLVARGADVNIVDSLRRTPLHWAVHEGNREIVHLLLQHNADINFRAELDQTPLHWAISQGDVDMLTLLVDSGSDVNAVDALQNAPLHWAIVPGRDTGVAAFLLDKGTDVNVVDGLGRTPLNWAVQCGLRGTAGLLLDNGADINRPDYLTGSPLHTAIRNDDHEMVCFLFKNGADINLINVDGKSPLYWAVEWGRTRMVRFLLDNKADVSCRTNSGETALHKAVDEGDESVISLLVQKHADVNALDDFGHSPLSLAMDKNERSIMQLLLGWQAGLSEHRFPCPER